VREGRRPLYSRDWADGRWVWCGCRSHRGGSQYGALNYNLMGYFGFAFVASRDVEYIYAMDRGSKDKLHPSAQRP
jgi:hypothetical protein